jgi:hypothetical protein
MSDQSAPVLSAIATLTPCARMPVSGSFAAPKPSSLFDVLSGNGNASKWARQSAPWDFSTLASSISRGSAVRLYSHTIVASSSAHR